MSLTYASVKEELDAATTLQELLDAAQLIQYVPGALDRHLLDGEVKTRTDVLKNSQ